MIKIHFQPIKLTLAFVLCAGAFLVAFYAQAQERTDTTPETRATSSETVVERQNTLPAERGENLEALQEARAERVEERTERIETRQAVRADRQAALTEIRQQRILNLSANISNRMEAAIARLFSVIERLETRIMKMKETGLDTTAAEAKLREAAEHVASARALLSNIDALVYNATTSEQPLTNWEGVRATYQEAAKLIRAGHQSLRETIALLQSAAPTPVAETTTTETAE